MKKIFAVTAICLLVASTALAANDLMRTTGNNISQAAVQFFAPDGTKTTALAVTTTTVDLTNYLLFQVESGSGTTCYMRLMPTSAKGTYAQTLFRTAGTRATFAKNVATPFVNFSGCTAGSYLLQ